MAAIKHEPAGLEGANTDPRPPAAAEGRRDLSDGDPLVVGVGDRRCHGQRRLGTAAEPDVCWELLVDLQ